MSNIHKKDIDKLLQKQFMATILQKHKPSDMITVYEHHFDISSCHRNIFSALTSPDMKNEILSNIYWDIGSNNLNPTVEEYSDDNGLFTQEYSRVGYYKAFEPIVFARNFYDMKTNYIEISEEFRLYFNLYHDIKTGKYIKLNDNGTEEVVAVISKTRAQIRVKEVKEFIAVKDMVLVMFFNNIEYSSYNLDELKLKEHDEEDKQENYIWKIGVRGDSLSGETEVFSRLCGKRIIEGFEKEKNGRYLFLSEPEKEYLDFIIDEDEYGNPISNTSNPSELGNFFGANPDSPNFLTPVKFKKTVLEKYYQESEKYSVEPGYLRCGDLWGLQMDNHHEDHVCVWLGDLGRDLPYIEQQHWRQYNIFGGDMISDAYFNQQLMCKPEPINQPDHIFKALHSKLINISRKKLGWELLLPLTEDDKHHMTIIRCIDTQEQKIFDDIIMGMTKVLIDSLNEKKLKKYIPLELRKDMKGISKLEYVLNEFSVDEAEEHIHFLRQFQDLRSKSVAHRKGSSYLKLINDMGLDSKSINENIVSLLNSANAFLQYLINVIESGALVK